jgi:hypothetical protein
MKGQLVREFTVSKSLLKTEGKVDPGIVEFLYHMRSKLNEKYRQWRIVISSEEMVLKLENLEGEVVINDTIPTGEDWGWVLDNCISFMAVPIEEEYLVG